MCQPLVHGGGIGKGADFWMFYLTNLCLFLITSVLYSTINP